jgi:hypothetical protein
VWGVLFEACVGCALALSARPVGLQLDAQGRRAESMIGSTTQRAANWEKVDALYWLAGLSSSERIAAAAAIPIATEGKALITPGAAGGGEVGVTPWGVTV